MTKSGYAVLCAAAAGLIFAAPANAMSLKDCNAEWSAMKANKTVGDTKYADFRKECLARPAATTGAPPATATKPAAPPKAAAAPAAPSGPAVFPSAVSPKYSSESAGKARMQTCLDQYNENKATNGNGGLKWIQKGGGYYSECNKKLKG
jgi:hypothetical protein